jgi:hypothetical protein
MSDLFEERVEEINEYFEFLTSFDNSSRDTRTLKILKSNCYLLLYNLIEGSVFEGINQIFLEINQQNISFEQLNDRYKKKWLNYKNSLINRDSFKPFDKDSNQILNEISRFYILNFKDKSGNVFEGYASYLKTQNKTDFSGTLDIRLIRDVAESYGFPIPAESYNEENKRLTEKERISKEGEVFLEIKNIRNKLAHGEVTFSEVGKLSTIDLIDKKERIVQYLSILLKNIDTFIEEQGYLKTT